jgi:carbamoyl-phosphate synthase large subunit
MNAEEAVAIAREIGYPVLLRPSYVLGGRAMMIVYDEAMLRDYVRRAEELQRAFPILVDHFLENATEIDVDALADGAAVVIAGVMQHIEEAGIHSGDSSCVLPAVSIGEEQHATLCEYTIKLAKELDVVGLMNVQYAIQNGQVYVLEVNPRASRTVPYVSKATGVPLAKIAARLMVGSKLGGFGLEPELPVHHAFVKSPVFPFQKLPGADTILGPEMKSTGEVMGVADSFGLAFAKAQLAARNRIPISGRIFISVNDHDKPLVIPIARDLAELGFSLVATQGTSQALRASGIPVERVFKVTERRPSIVDLVKSAEIDLIINTPLGRSSRQDDRLIRRAAVQHGVTCITTLSAAGAVIAGIRELRKGQVWVASLQELHQNAQERCHSERSEESRPALR